MTARPAAHQRPDDRHGRDVYGLIGKISAVPGQRDALEALLLEGTQVMPGLPQLCDRH